MNSRPPAPKAVDPKPADQCQNARTAWSGMYRSPRFDTARTPPIASLRAQYARKRGRGEGGWREAYIGPERDLVESPHEGPLTQDPRTVERSQFGQTDKLRTPILTRWSGRWYVLHWGRSTVTAPEQSSSVTHTRRSGAVRQDRMPSDRWRVETPCQLVSRFFARSALIKDLPLARTGWSGVPGQTTTSQSTT